MRISLDGLAVVLDGAREVDAEVLDVTSTVVGASHSFSVSGGITVTVYEACE